MITQSLTGEFVATTILSAVMTCPSLVVTFAGSPSSTL